MCFQLSDKMVSIQQVAEHESRDSAKLADSVKKDDSGRSPDQLLEVLRFQRREKETAESRLAVVQAEANRYEQRAKHLDRELAEATKAIEEERNRAKVGRNCFLSYKAGYWKIYIKAIEEERNRAQVGKNCFLS